MFDNGNDDVYGATVKRLEPDIHSIDASAFYASAAISLKRIADAMDNAMTDEDIGRVAAIIGDRLSVGTSMGLHALKAINDAGYKMVRVVKP